MLGCGRWSDVVTTVRWCGDGDSCSYESGFGEGQESEISRWFRVKGKLFEFNVF